MYNTIEYQIIKPTFQINTFVERIFVFYEFNVN